MTTPVSNPTTPTVPASTTPGSGANGAASNSSSTGAAAQAGLNSNYMDFINLLTTQLQNQDPTNPTDTNQLTEEIAQLSEVQAQLNTNTLLQQLVTLMGNSQATTAVSYIGKQVDATGNQTELTGSQATLVYSLPSGASTASVTITNSAGQTVFSGPGTTIAGRNQVQWDGTDSATGGTAPDGTYTFTVTAADSSGNPITATTMTTGVVTAVDTQSGTSSLSLGGGLSVPLNNVQAIYTPGSNPTAVS